jgi:molybdenum cofactor guanylyltransferase
VIGAILAGGAGRRIGGEKAARRLGERPLATYPAVALEHVCDRVVLVCKRATALPDGWEWEVWGGEPDEPRHPAAGIAYAIERAGEAVLVCAADMPFVEPSHCRRLSAAYDGEAVAVVASSGGDSQPVLGIYSPAAVGPLRAAAEAATPLRAAVAELEPRFVELPADALRSVDTPEDLSRARGSLRAR